MGVRHVAAAAHGVAEATQAGERAAEAPPAGERGSSGRPAAQRRQELVELYHHLRDCHECPLKATRTKLVFGSGNADADLMLVGEAPGAHEDRQGLPFVGRAGQLLDELLAEIGLARTDVFIANTLKCRPPGNRDPQPDEIEECTPHLFRQVELIEPRVICTLGNFATKLLTGSPQGITRVRGRTQDRELAGRSVRLYPIFHPAAALRSDATRQQLREDFHRLPDLLAEPRPEPDTAESLAGGAAVAAGAAAAIARPAEAPSGSRSSEQLEVDQLGLFG